MWRTFTLYFVSISSLPALEVHLPAKQDSPRVVPFMKGLPDRLRRLSRSTYRESEQVKGGVDGKIDWGGTVEMYARKGYVDRTSFVCTRQQTEYDTPANQVLKRLLIELKSVLRMNLRRPLTIRTHMHGCPSGSTRMGS